MTLMIPVVGVEEPGLKKVLSLTQGHLPRKGRLWPLTGELRGRIPVPQMFCPALGFALPLGPPQKATGPRQGKAQLALPPHSPSRDSQSTTV